MSARRAVVLTLAGVLAVFLVLGNTAREPSETEKLARIDRGHVITREIYSGKIEARNVVTVMSRYKGFATVVDLAREGITVREGDLLAQFDSAELERELLRLEKEFALAESEYESQQNAIIPMELDELAVELRRAAEAAEAEKQYLRDSLTLADENIISKFEIEQQESKVSQLEAEYRGLEKRYKLTQDYLHPAMRQRARAKLHSARQALELARLQLSNTRIHAPSGGTLIYKPLHINGEYRGLRIGDTLHANQPFMVISDLADLVLHAMIPENEFSKLKPGQPVLMFPQAFPELRLSGIVEKVGVVAETVPGKPAWQKFFRLTIGIDDKDERLRPGMSVVAHVISNEKRDVVRIPRRAVTWRADTPFCDVRVALDTQQRELRIGAADSEHFEVIDGLQPGEMVVLR